MVDYQTISIVLTGIGMIIALTYYGLQIRNQNNTRQAQVFMQINSHFHNKEFLRDSREIFSWKYTDYQDFKTKYSREVDIEAELKWASMGSFFEGIGVLVYRKLISPEIVDDLISSYVIRYWELMRPAIQGYREEFNIPQAYEWVEYLYNKIRSISEREHPELSGDTIRSYNP